LSSAGALLYNPGPKRSGVSMSRVVHFEVLSRRPKEAAAFYEKALGWKPLAWGGPPAYWLLSTGPRAAPGIDGAVMQRHFPQAVINTVWVPSLAHATHRIEGAGGKRVHGPSEIPGVGLHAYFSDPEGTLFGVLQPEQRKRMRRGAKSAIPRARAKRKVGAQAKRNRPAAAARPSKRAPRKPGR
jgi:uncharacterized protein